ncbi:A disintegrin and metalloproteinase with thrombospondin motifs adt-2-like [Gigantopelta aegis]|uniref:A disintegrin and metalloproteinase with thrombospondin motifs adt-2-like n=1 Tax=Gigantopelta aegis TaxID=1735272 RepID=UPI001B88CF91|nr:A disintegrin and metalloproteinase with thrombospondin motifs adt-2-like [Gigantopelta aegis]
MVNAQLTLDNFRSWLTNNSRLPDYDHAMLVTGYDLFSEDRGYRFNVTTGLAYFRGMCKTTDGSSSSLFEDHGAFQSVRTIAHELGHR